MLLKTLGVGWIMLRRTVRLVVSLLRKKTLKATTQTQEDMMSSKQNIITRSPQTAELPTKTYFPTQLRYKLYDVFGSICYAGTDYNKALNKAKLLPSMFALYAVDENDIIVGALWSAQGSGIPVVKLDSLMPN